MWGRGGESAEERSEGTRSDRTTHFPPLLTALQQTGVSFQYLLTLSPKAPGKGKKKPWKGWGCSGMHPCQNGCLTWGHGERGDMGVRGCGLWEGLYKRKQQLATAVWSLNLHLKQEVLLSSFPRFLMMTILLFQEEKPAVTLIKNFTIFQTFQECRSFPKKPPNNTSKCSLLLYLTF